MAISMASNFPLFALGGRAVSGIIILPGLVWLHQEGMWLPFFCPRYTNWEDRYRLLVNWNSYIQFRKYRDDE